MPENWERLESSLILPTLTLMYTFILQKKARKRRFREEADEEEQGTDAQPQYKGVFPC